ISLVLVIIPIAILPENLIVDNFGRTRGLDVGGAYKEWLNSPVPLAVPRDGTIFRQSVLFTGRSVSHRIFFRRFGYAHPALPSSSCRPWRPAPDRLRLFRLDCAFFRSCTDRSV